MKKLNLALQSYDKYRNNLKAKAGLLQSDRLFDWGKERELLLAEIDERDFYAFLEKFRSFLKEIIGSLDYKG